MTHPPVETLTEHVLGTLPTGELSAVDAHLAECADCREACRDLGDALGAYALSLTPAAPAPDLRARLVVAAREAHLVEVAHLFHLDVDAARAVLADADDPARWVPTDIPGVAAFHLDGGATTAGADCGLVRVPAGARFPEHTHVGEERVLVLEGRIHDSSGRAYGPGERCDRLAGTRHHYTVGPECDLVVATVIFGGIEVG